MGWVQLLDQLAVTSSLRSTATQNFLNTPLWGQGQRSKSLVPYQSPCRLVMSIFALLWLFSPIGHELLKSWEMFAFSLHTYLNFSHTVWDQQLLLSYGGNSIKNTTCFIRNDSLHFPPWLTERLQKRPGEFVLFIFLRNGGTKILPVTWYGLKKGRRGNLRSLLLTL